VNGVSSTEYLKEKMLNQSVEGVSVYLRGIAWFVLSLVISVINDVFAKYLGQDLHSFQITFMRFLFGTLTLLPFMLYYGKKAFRTERVGLHIFRGGVLFVAIALWCFGLTIAPISTATTLNFTIPMFTLVLAIPFLGEKVGLSRWVATIIGFVGVLVVIGPGHVDFTPLTLLLLLSAVLFAGLDVINKKFVVKESMLAMLFYTALFTTLLGAIPAYKVWHALSLSQYSLLFLLGCGANLILYCLLKGFALADASALAPFRYLELLFSAGLGFFIFKEVPILGTCIGALIIIPSTLFIILYETKRGQQVELDFDLSEEGAVRGVEKTDA